MHNFVCICPIIKQACPEKKDRISLFDEDFLTKTNNFTTFTMDFF